ncbi:MAG: phosphate acyltransferase PlsX [Oscillospiraceae bacterium]|nr:phosphate acyltransferase PlsX [Oscillospiraceae bacterium]
MKIVIDGYGGDHTPKEALAGSMLALSEYDDIEIVITGKEQGLAECAAKLEIDVKNTDRLSFVNAPGILSMTDDPMSIRKEKADSSMGKGFNLLKSGEADALVSGGNTGALAVGCTLLAGRIKGIIRTALAPIMPSASGCFILVDAGANVECRPDMLMQFGIMGSIYMEQVLGVNSPKVGLVNVGLEENKGTPLQRETYTLLKSSAAVNFTGNIEAREIPLGHCDVVVADGFTGNIILKLEEGMGSFISSELKSMFGASLKTKIVAMLVMKQIKAFKKKMDYKEYGGAPFLGSSKPVIKAHGSSDAKAFFNAIRQARMCVKQNVVRMIRESVAKQGNFDGNILDI